MKRIVTSQLLFALLVPCCSLTAYASEVVTTVGEVSSRDVDYKEFAVTRDEMQFGKKEQCTVTVSQPYSYSTKIPKDANDNSTNSNTNKDDNKNNNKGNVGNGSGKGDGKGNGNVQTGDGTPIALYSSIATLGAMGMMGFKAKSKKTK